jgi:two-component system chemotaxis sensor kinase CheA
MSDYLDPNNEELLKDFFSEAEQQVAQLEQNILVLENDPSNKDAINEIFRAAHTLKGAAGTVQMKELAGFTHLVEDVFDAIRTVDSGRRTDDSVSPIFYRFNQKYVSKRMAGTHYTGDVLLYKQFSIFSINRRDRKGPSVVETGKDTKGRSNQSKPNVL